MDTMKATMKPRAPQVRCYKCGSPDIFALCHHCWHPGCARHVGPTPHWAERLLGKEGAGRGLENDPADHCRECRHTAVDHRRALGMAAVAVATAAIITAWLSPATALALVLVGVLLAGWAYLTARRRAASQRVGMPLALHPKINNVRLVERLGVSITLVREGSYKTSLRPVEGEVTTDLVFGRPDRDRLDRHASKHVSGRNTRFCAGFLVLQGGIGIGQQSDLAGPVRPLEGTTGAYPVFRAEDPHASSPWRQVLSYRLAREPVIRQGPVWVTPSLVPESDRRALELDIQWVDLGPRDQRISLDVIELIQLRYPATWGKVEQASERAIQAVIAQDCGGPDALRSVEWRQLLPNHQQRQARRLTLVIRFEERIDAEDLISGRLEAAMRGALSGVDGVRLYSSLGKRRDDWRGATIRTRVEADFKLSLASIRYQDVRIVPEREVKQDDNYADEFSVIPDDETVIELTNALSENYYLKRVVEHPPQSGGRADHVQRYWDIAGRHYDGVYPIDFQMILTGEEIHRGSVRPVDGTTKVRIVVQGAHTDDKMKDRIDEEWEGLRALTRETLNELASNGRRPAWGDPPGGWSDPWVAASGQAHHGPDPSRSGQRLLKRLGKLDEALLDGRITPEQYEEMKARAEQEFGGR
jgi:hypothetical protein